MHATTYRHPGRFRRTLLALGLACTCGFAPAGAAEPAPDGWTALTLRPGERQLFLDDFVLGDLDGVSRVIHPPRKYEHNPVLAPDLPSDGAAIQARDAPSWDEQEQVWKLWYIRFGDDGNGAGGAGFARSKDGLHWEKPILGLVESHGSRRNNLTVVQGRPKAFIQHVMIDPHAPPERRYKGLIGPHGREPIVSADGFTFTWLDVPPIPSEDESHLNWDDFAHQFILTVKQPGPFGRSVYLSLSPDFEHWTKPELIYHADAQDQALGAQYLREIEGDARYWRPTVNHPHEYNVEIYNMAVFRYEGLYIGLPNYFESSGRIPLPRGNQDGINSPKLACSRDLRAWTRVGDRAHFLPISPLGPGVIDTGQIMASSHPVRHGDELWFYYSGIDVRHRPNVPRVIDEYRGAICVAMLRVDGFVSLHAGPDGGFVDTRPVVLDGGRLCVNVTAPGEVRVELTSRDGREPLAGWEAGACVPISGDHARMEVRWPGRSLAELRGRAVRVRFHLKDADLYSFWLEP